MASSHQLPAASQNTNRVRTSCGLLKSAINGDQNRWKPGVGSRELEAGSCSLLIEQLAVFLLLHLVDQADLLVGDLLHVVQAAALIVF